MLERFCMKLVLPANNPIEEALDLTKRLEVETNDFCDKSILYNEATSFWMSLIIGTRLDIALAIGKLLKCCERPERKHWTAVMHMLRYISGSKSLGICYGGDSSIVPFGFSDAD